MRTKNVIGVLENLKHDKCGYEVTAINQAIKCVKDMHTLEKMIREQRKYEKDEATEVLGYNPYQE